MKNKSLFLITIFIVFAMAAVGVFFSKGTYSTGALKKLSASAAKTVKKAANEKNAAVKRGAASSGQSIGAVKPAGKVLPDGSAPKGFSTEAPAPLAPQISPPESFSAEMPRPASIAAQDVPNSGFADLKDILQKHEDASVVRNREAADRLTAMETALAAQGKKLEEVNLRDDQFIYALRQLSDSVYQAGSARNPEPVPLPTPNPDATIEIETETGTEPPKPEPAADPLGKDLFLWLSFDDAETDSTLVKDQSGLNNDGARIGAAPMQEKYCVKGKCLSFNGVSDYVLIPDAFSLRGMAQLTQEAWVNFKSVASGPVVIGKVGSYDLYINNSEVLSSDYKVATGGSVPLNEWVHLIMTYDGEKVKLYINGVQVALGQSSGPIGSGSNPLEIGRWASRTEYVNGLIDEVRLYSRALTDADVKDRYLEGRNLLDARSLTQ